MELLIVGLVCVIVGFTLGIFINKYYSRKNYDLQSDMKTVFRGISTEILTENQNSFFESVKPILMHHNKGSEKILNIHKTALDELIKPLNKNLAEISNRNKEIEDKRIGAYSDLKSKLGDLSNREKELHSQVLKLSTVLQSSSKTRGNWGEIQLKNIVEITGMTEHCSFEIQKKLPDGSQPDMIINLPGNRKVIIDAKTPGFFDLDETTKTNEEIEKNLINRIREHIRLLGSKKYHESVGNAFDYVIMFLPIESLFKTAVDKDPKIIEKGLSHKVIIASPTTLMAILRSIAFSWREARLSENAKEISKIGIELYKRILTFNEHLTSLGKNLTSTVDKYNKHLRSYESMLIPGARKLKEMGASIETKELNPPNEIVTIPRTPQLFDSKKQKLEEEN
jgi:DNA recombination protein RmuC